MRAANAPRRVQPRPAKNDGKQMRGHPASAATIGSTKSVWCLACFETQVGEVIKVSGISDPFPSDIGGKELPGFSPYQSSSVQIGPLPMRQILNQLALRVQQCMLVVV